MPQCPCLNADINGYTTERVTSELDIIMGEGMQMANEEIELKSGKHCLVRLKYCLHNRSRSMCDMGSFVKFV
jgi:hypothetical protein